MTQRFEIISLKNDHKNKQNPQKEHSACMNSNSFLLIKTKDK